MRSHGAVASSEFAEPVLQAVYEDPRTAPIREELRSTLVFLEKVTLTPESVTADDVRLVFAAGVRPAAVRDALHVAYMFNLITRVADALEFAIPSDEQFQESGQVLLRFGYML